MVRYKISKQKVPKAKGKRHCEQCILPVQFDLSASWSADPRSDMEGRRQRLPVNIEGLWRNFVLLLACCYGLLTVKPSSCTIPVDSE